MEKSHKSGFYLPLGGVGMETGRELLNDRLEKMKRPF